MKVQQLSLPTSKAVKYTVTAEGTILKTENGKVTTVKKLKLTDTDAFWYLIDDDGDLVREFKDLPKPTERTLRTHKTEPPSAKLGAKELLKRIDKLLFPPESDNLGFSGFVFTNEEVSRRAYEKEFERVAAELSYALGPGREVIDAEERPGVVFEWRGRHVLLQYEWQPDQTPFASLDLVWVDDEDMAQLQPRAPKKRPKKKG